ncbi:sorting nexin [Kappamyces sp. JEL0680]|nr:sorting nexin [Kappamyces sp. JEL0680]
MAPKKRKLFPKPLLDQKALLEAFEAEGINLKHVQVIWRHFIQKGTTDFSTIDNIPKKAIEILNRDFVPLTSRVVTRTDAKDKSTSKLLIELQDGQRVETVIMRYGDVALDSYPVAQKEKLSKDGEFQFKSNKRATVCVSSQVGCAMGCTFCATGTMNLLANLHSAEILEQLCKPDALTADHANQVEKIRNVVFMGMGEPLDNYDAVLQAVDAMIDTRYFSLSPTHVTISTVGVVPRLISLAKDLPNIGLALSLHAPTQELRQVIVPTSKAWHISKIMDAATAFIDNQNKSVKSANRRRHILVEYVLIRDVNDSAETAHHLGQLLQGKDVLLNVIPYNPTSVPFDYKPPLQEVCETFVGITRSYDVFTLFRQELGQDVSAACGQLVIDNQKSMKEPAGCDIGDMEDLGKRDGSAKPPAVRKRNGTTNNSDDGPLEADECKLSVAPGKLNENLPGILIQYGILALALWGVARLGTKLFSH